MEGIRQNYANTNVHDSDSTDSEPEGDIGGRQGDVGDWPDRAPRVRGRPPFRGPDGESTLPRPPLRIRIQNGRVVNIPPPPAPSSPPPPRTPPPTVSPPPGDGTDRFVRVVPRPRCEGPPPSSPPDADRRPAADAPPPRRIRLHLARVDPPLTATPTTSAATSTTATTARRRYAGPMPATAPPHQRDAAVGPSRPMNADQTFAPIAPPHENTTPAPPRGRIITAAPEVRERVQALAAAAAQAAERGLPPSDGSTQRNYEGLPRGLKWVPRPDEANPTLLFDPLGTPFTCMMPVPACLESMPGGVFLVHTRPAPAETFYYINDSGAYYPRSFNASSLRM